MTFPRLTTPRGRKEETASLKQLWDSCKADKKKLDSLLEVSGEEAMEDLRAVAPAMEALVDLTADFAERYRVEKLRLNSLDFSDQEHLALRLLVKEDGAPTELGEQVSARYQEILVDEYQDTNVGAKRHLPGGVQGRSEYLHRGRRQAEHLPFRLADPTIFLEKYQRFRSWEEAQPGEERKILLSKNFRSRRECWMRPTSFSAPSSLRRWERWPMGRTRRCTLVRSTIRPGRTAPWSSI